MPLVRSPALVLHGFAYGDTSRILRLLTPHYGVRSVIAKGAQRPRSRFGALLEPFTEGEALFYLREGRDLLTLSDFSLVRSRQNLGRDLAAFTGAALIAELTLRTGTEEPNPELYDALIAALDELAIGEGDVAATALAHLWRLVALLGFEPQLESCVHCGRPLAEGEAARFDIAAGSIACLACRPSGRVVDAATRLEVHTMIRGGSAGAARGNRGLHGALLRAFLSEHLSGDRPLRALPLFLEQLR